MNELKLSSSHDIPQIESQLLVWQLRSLEASMKEAVDRGRIAWEEGLAILFGIEECELQRQGKGETVPLDGQIIEDITLPGDIGMVQVGTETVALGCPSPILS